jgi:hypothetical protein
MGAWPSAFTIALGKAETLGKMGSQASQNLLLCPVQHTSKW